MLAGMIRGDLWIEPGMGHAENAMAPGCSIGWTSGRRPPCLGRFSDDRANDGELPTSQPTGRHVTPSRRSRRRRHEPHPAGGLSAVLAGVLALGAALGPVPTLVGVAVVQAVLVVGWVLGNELPGRIGAITLGLLAAAGADAAVCTGTAAAIRRSWACSPWPFH